MNELMSLEEIEVWHNRVSNHGLIELLTYPTLEKIFDTARAAHHYKNVMQHYKDVWKGYVESDSDTERQLQEMAKPYLSQLELYGDSNGVPGIGGIAEALCEKLKDLEAQYKECQEAEGNACEALSLLEKTIARLKSNEESARAALDASFNEGGLLLEENEKLRNRVKVLDEALKAARSSD